MTLEDRALLRNRRLTADLTVGEIEVDDPVNQLEILETHVGGEL
jgi:hypothetical protein